MVQGLKVFQYRRLSLKTSILATPKQLRNYSRCLFLKAIPDSDFRYFSKLWRVRLRNTPKARIHSNLFRSFWRNLALKLGTERHLPKRPSTGCSPTGHISVL